MRIGPVVAFAAFSLSPTLAAHAAALQPPSGGVQLSTNISDSSYTYGSGSHTLTDSLGTVSGANALGSDPAVSGSFTVTTLQAIPASPYNIPIGFDSESSLFYQFQVNGPAGQTASVNISSLGSASVSNTGSIAGYNLNATAYLSVFNGPSAPILTETACAGAPSLVSDPCGSISAGLSNSFNVNQLLNVLTNTPYYVNLYTSDSMEATASPGATGTFTAQSSVDPTITLVTTDPAYSLQFSPGLLSATTPEPSSFTLLASGLAGLAAVARRKLLSRPTRNRTL